MNFSLKYNKQIKILTLIVGLGTILITLISYSFLPKDIITQIGFNGSFNTNNKLLYTVIILIISITSVILSKKDKYKDSVIHCLIGNSIVFILNIIIILVNLSL